MITVLLSGLLTVANAKSSLDILVMADWGGKKVYPYKTPDEFASATEMGKVADQFDVDMVWGLGDNFYDEGIKNEFDPRFNETFESVFNATSLSNIPFYMVAGNHDHRGNVTGQIMYSNHSERWMFPDLWYSKTFKVPGGNLTVQLVMIDTVILEGITFDQEYCDSHNMVHCLIHPEGPVDPEMARAQYEWIESTLANSTADFIIVAGHYPVYSVAEHGPTKGLIEKLIPMLHRYNVSTYMSGHDHTFEYIVSEGIDYIDTGGTHECNPSTAHQRSIPENSLQFRGCDQGGFTRIKVDADGLSVYYYFGNSDHIRYTVPTRKARHL